MKKQTSEIISGEGLVNNVHRVLNLGLDVHYRQVTVAMQEDGGRIKSAGKLGHPEFLNWVLKKLEEGWEIYNLQLLRSRSQRLLVTPEASGTGGQKPGGGAQGHGSGRPEAKD
jgi:hypothetical protein